MSKVQVISTKDSVSKGVKMLVYGASGVGKTTLIKTLPDPIIISSESGLLSLADEDIPAIEVHDEQSLKDAIKYALDSVYLTLCLDSISDISDAILTDLLGKFNDGRQAYGKMNQVVKKELRNLRGVEKNVYVTAMEGKAEVNGVVTVAPDMPGKTLTNDIPYIFDLVMRLEATRKGERIIHTAATAMQTCKDRSGKLDNKEAPDLGAIINKISGD